MADIHYDNYYTDYIRTIKPPLSLTGASVYLKRNWNTVDFSADSENRKNNNEVVVQLPHSHAAFKKLS